MRRPPILRGCGGPAPYFAIGVAKFAAKE